MKRATKRPGPQTPPLDHSSEFGVVAIGASAGGLEACTALVDALPLNHGLALILVQHLEPTRASMMVELLAKRTATVVEEARDGVQLQPDHLYIIPPGRDLRVADGVLHPSELDPRPGLHLRCDVLFNSLAEAWGPRTSCVILSGTGSDGSLGIEAVKRAGGFVVVQDPDEAAHAEMPESAIRTGIVDLVLEAADIPNALIAHDRVRRRDQASAGPTPGPDAATPDTRKPDAHAKDDDAPVDGLAAIIDLLRIENGLDFTHYKPGTLRRQIARRMALVPLPADRLDRYLTFLRKNNGEVLLLAKDLLIQVTSFFRDKAVFDRVANSVIPDLIRDHPTERPIRVWVAGCSTGEEMYSLAMLFQERIAASHRDIRLQMFGSDLDASAIARARDGLYPDSIESVVSKARLRRFFSKEEHGYRVSPDLRAAVVFTVQDVLADPPFAQLDMVSCRNLLIYLQPEAQAKVLTLLHFALRQGGILLLGNAETPGSLDASFEVMSKPDRLYRRIGRANTGLSLPASRTGTRADPFATTVRAPSRQPWLAELGRRLVLETYAPASILIDSENRCLFTLGPIDRYLRLAPGHPSHDVLTMARPGLRPRLRSAIDQSRAAGSRIVIGGRMSPSETQFSFNVDVQPVSGNDEKLLLVCFVDVAAPEPRPARAGSHAASIVVGLERDLKASRDELQDALRDLDLSAEDHKAANEEARSVNEEYQSTNEELMASKEELQSLNEELSSLNSQLQETLEQQRTTSDDLQNVLYSTDVATLFLDPELRIRFFTPATRLLFSVIPGDIGRPLADLRSLASDDVLELDAKAVLGGQAPLEREIEAQSGAWFRRRVLPYHTHDNRIEGVVITFNDITSRKNTSKALELAKRDAELANAAKSRFLAAASHDLRQPLQTMSLLQGLLTKTVEGDRTQRLVARLGETLNATTSMLNTLLDINQIENGQVHSNVVAFDVDDLLSRMREEFNYHAQSSGLQFHVVSCSLRIVSDVRLLEQMVRNLLANAMKYTSAGKILLGCRRHGHLLSLQVWDTGVGIPEQELEAIFEEYHQLDNAARERSRGLGLGLSIVQSLGRLLGHKVSVHSQLGRGSMFSLDVLLEAGASESPGAAPVDGIAPLPLAADDAGSILIVEDDSDMKDLMELLLSGEGYRTWSSSDGAAAIELVAKTAIKPDLLLADYNLPGELNGRQLAERLRDIMGRDIPVIILTGDVSLATAAEVAAGGFQQLNKPVRNVEVLDTIRKCLASARPLEAVPGKPGPAGHETVGKAAVFVIDDDRQIRKTIRAVLEQDGHEVECFPTAEAYLHPYPRDRAGCVLIDANLPGISGIALLQRLHAEGRQLPVIMITGSSEVSLAVEAMKAGAVDFIEKPVEAKELLASVRKALEKSANSDELSARRERAADQMSTLTSRQHEVMVMVLAGSPSKNIAADLNISQRTVENHRASIMRKTGATSVPALARLAIAAAGSGPAHPHANVRKVVR
ncbi:chemotaxis protein CheB [Lichenicola sp.]|uniref:chemotaxis protein CheB n=1 Tax=Lichenicola sp. TaxID=2804529 RepID=UPI003AFFAAD8